MFLIAHTHRAAPLSIPVLILESIPPQYPYNIRINTLTILHIGIEKLILQLEEATQRRRCNHLRRQRTRVLLDQLGPGVQEALEQTMRVGSGISMDRLDHFSLMGVGHVAGRSLVCVAHGQRCVVSIHKSVIVNMMPTHRRTYFVL